MKLKHVRVNVTDLEKAIDWYKEILGFTVEATWPPEKPNYVHFKSEGGAIFALMEDEKAPSQGRFNFYVDDVDELWNKIKHEVEIIENLFDTAYGSRKFSILDLDGNELGFVQDEK